MSDLTGFGYFTISEPQLNSLTSQNNVFNSPYLYRKVCSLCTIIYTMSYNVSLGSSKVLILGNIHFYARVT